MGEAVNAELKAVDKSEPLPELPDPVIHPLPINDLRGWLLAERYLKMALEHTDEWALEDVAAQFCYGKVGIILCLDRHRIPFGALCVEVCDYPKKRVLQVHLFGANDHTEDLWMRFIWPQLQDLAKNLGCATIMGTGRDGWVRKLHAKHRYLWEVGLCPDQEK